MEDLIDPEFENMYEANFDFWLNFIWYDLPMWNVDGEWKTVEDALLALKNSWI